MGRAHFELVQYAEALRAFEHAQAIEPHRLVGMEVSRMGRLRRGAERPGSPSPPHTPQPLAACPSRRAAPPPHPPPPPPPFPQVHSTILWHLKKEVPLCYLAKRALDFERTSPYACCVVGNCFSLQKEHDTALKFFQRAIQLQPDFA